MKNILTISDEIALMNDEIRSDKLIQDIDFYKDEYKYEEFEEWYKTGFISFHDEENQFHMFKDAQEKGLVNNPFYDDDMAYRAWKYDSSYEEQPFITPNELNNKIHEKWPNYFDCQKTQAHKKFREIMSMIMR